MRTRAAALSRAGRRVPRFTPLVLAVALIGVGSDASATRGPNASALPPPLKSSAGPAIYVSTRGSDSNAGTIAEPKRTIQHALNRVRPGQRIIVRGGLYEESLRFERSGARTAPITLAAFRAELPVVRPPAREGRDTYAIEITASYVRVKGFVFEGASGTSSANIYVEDDASSVELRGNEIRGGQDQGIYTDPETNNVQVIGNLVHHNGAGIEGQHQSHGMYLKGTRHLIANNLVYDHPHGFGIHLYGENVGTIVAGNTVAHNGWSGIVVGGEGVRGITISNNIFAFNGRYGIAHDSDTPEDSRVSTNLLRGNGWGAIEPDFEKTDFGGNLVSHPQFVNPQKRDFRLRRRSPAIDHAVAAYSMQVDHDGVARPQGRASDIGAFEWTRRP